MWYIIFYNICHYCVYFIFHIRVKRVKEQNIFLPLCKSHKIEINQTLVPLEIAFFFVFFYTTIVTFSVLFQVRRTRIKKGENKKNAGETIVPRDELHKFQRYLEECWEYHFKYMFVLTIVALILCCNVNFNTNIRLQKLI